MRTPPTVNPVGRRRRRPSTSIRRGAPTFVAVWAIAVAAPATGVGQHSTWISPDGEPLPFADDDAVLEFLRTAEVVDTREMSGTTRPLEVLLEKDGLRMHAVFRHLDERRDRYRYRNRTHPFFRDSYIFEAAAYELSRILGLAVVPPVVLRNIHGRPGSLQAFVEETMRETDRRDRGLQPPDPRAWNRQWERMELFDQIIFNLDRNSGNVLIDRNWRIWLIDHTLAFRRYGYLDDPDEVRRCERGLWERLNALDEEEVRRRLQPYLLSPEIDGLLTRLEAVRSLLRRLIEEKGEDAVLYTA